MKRKILVFVLLTAVLVFQLIQVSYAPPVLLSSGSGFNVEVTGAIAFQSDDTLLIEVLTGVLNSSSASLSLYTRKGSFSFTALNNSTIEVSSPDAEGGFDMSITGANQTTQTDRFVHQATILTGNTVTITWGWRLESWIDHTMLALGISGLILMVASPTWGAMAIRKKGLDPASMERLYYAGFLFCVGFGLLVMWLWS